MKRATLPRVFLFLAISLSILLAIFIIKRRNIHFDEEGLPHLVLVWYDWDDSKTCLIEYPVFIPMTPKQIGDENHKGEPGCPPPGSTGFSITVDQRHCIDILPQRLKLPPALQEKDALNPDLAIGKYRIDVWTGDNYFLFEPEYQGEDCLPVGNGKNWYLIMTRSFSVGN